MSPVGAVLAVVRQLAQSPDVVAPEGRDVDESALQLRPTLRALTASPLPGSQVLLGEELADTLLSAVTFVSCDCDPGAQEWSLLLADLLAAVIPSR